MRLKLILADADGWALSVPFASVAATKGNRYSYQSTSSYLLHVGANYSIVYIDTKL